MKRSHLKTVYIGLVLVCILGMGVDLIAKAQKTVSPKYNLLVFGKLRLNPKGDAEIAEKLMVEKLLPAAKGIEGLKITALKRMQIPGLSEQMQTDQPDFVMMAELADLSVFGKLIAATPANLREYGEQMKVQAGKPEFELYQILEASTDRVEQ